MDGRDRDECAAWRQGEWFRVLHPAGRDCFHFLHINILLHVYFIILSLQTSFFYLCLWPNRWLNLSATNERTRISVPFSVIEGRVWLAGWRLAFSVRAMPSIVARAEKAERPAQLPLGWGTVLRESTPRRCFLSLI